MDWFRMYNEFASDAKVQSMPEAMQRRLVMLLCLRCSNALVTLHDDEIAFALRISEQELAETKALFMRKGFVDESWEIANWDKRQFASDSSAARVAKHRAAKKINPQEPPKEEEIPCNVTVTPQNRTDTEQIQNRTDKKELRDPAMPDAPKFEPLAALLSESVDPQVAKDWLAIRKTKRLPLTLTAWNDIKREAEKASMSVADAVTHSCRRSRAGFEASWLLKDARAGPAGKEVKFDPVAYVNQNRIAQ